MTIGYLIAAFSCGVLATTLGACQTFVLCGIIGFAGIGAAAAMNAAALVSPEMAGLFFPAVAGGQADTMTAVLGNLGPIIENMAFGPMFAPAVAFSAPIWAGTYAKVRGYIKPEELGGTQSWLPQIEPFRKLDVLLAGGVGGVIGALLSWIITGVLGIGMDGHAAAIFITCVVCKMIAGEGFISPVTDPSKGNRFDPRQDQGWVPHLSRASMRYVIAIFLGACFAYAEYQLMLNPVTFSTAHIIGFLVGAIALSFLMMDFQVQVLPPITASACFVVKGMVIAIGNTPEAVAQVSPVTFMLWGAAGGCIGIIACHILIQTFKAFSNAYIDPPACAIIVSSFMGFTVIAGNEGLARGIAFPVCILAVCTIHMIWQEFRLKQTAASSN